MSDPLPDLVFRCHKCGKYISVVFQNGSFNEWKNISKEEMTAMVLLGIKYANDVWCTECQEDLARWRNDYIENPRVQPE